MRTLAYLFIIVFTPLLVLLNFRLLVFNHNYYQSQFQKLSVYEEFGSEELVDNQSRRLLDYLCCQATLDQQFFTDQERLHLADVKNLIRLANIQLILNLVLALVIIVTLIIRKKTKLLIFAFKWASITAIIAIIVLWPLSQLNFDRLFLQFHLLSFDNDFWQLPASSNLIKLFPQQFFADFANRIAYQTAGMAAIILVITLTLPKSISNRHKKK